MRLAPLCALIALAAGCAATPGADAGADVDDLRREFPEPPDGGLQFVTPEYVIPAATEQQWCLFTTYEGPDVGLHAQYTYQSDLGHHVVVNASTADPDDWPDGTVIECTDTEDLPMTDLDPVMVGGELGNGDNGHEGQLELPDGMAAKLDEGTRLILQSHYVNVTDRDILVQDAVNFELIAEDEVDVWAAPFVHIETDHPIPANSDHSLDFTCTWEDELNVLFLGGHMHEWGRAIQTTLTRDDETQVIYDIPEWDAVYRDAPPYLEYAEGEFVVQPGDAFTTHCEWTNTTDQVLDFPAEMCVTFGMVYPYKVPLVCEAD